jgi:hypothetical protein
MTKATLILAVALMAITVSAQPGAAPVVDGYLDGADGVRLFYRKVGNLPSVAVLLHGGPGSNMNGVWPDLQRLANTRSVVMYDQRGHPGPGA